LQDAIKEAAKTAEEGDVVLLSPGGTSYDAFVDFEERGNYYAKWISEL
jgi:UDP-N-acetylmuramoylalanine--D-glutamate ligase